MNQLNWREFDMEKKKEYAEWLYLKRTEILFYLEKKWEELTESQRMKLFSKIDEFDERFFEVMQDMEKEKEKKRKNKNTMRVGNLTLF